MKTLEEPPAYAVIVLIAADSSKILPTIRSRCRTVHFQPLDSSEVARLVTQLEWAEDPQAAEAAAALSGGSLAVAQQLLNANLRTMRTALFSGLSKPAFQPFTIAQNVLAALDAIGGDTQRQRVHAQCVVRFVIDFYEDALRQWCGVASDGRKSEEAGAFLQRFAAQEPETAELIGRAIDRAVDAEEQLAGNVAIPLCLEALFSDLATLVGGRSAKSSASPDNVHGRYAAWNRPLHFGKRTIGQRSERHRLGQRPRMRPTAKPVACTALATATPGMIWNRHMTNQPTIQTTMLGAM